MTLPGRPTRATDAAPPCGTAFQATLRQLPSLVAGAPEASAALAVAWRRLHAWCARAAGANAPAPPEPPPAAAFLPVWGGHAVLRPPGAALCIHCSQMFRGVRRADTPCRPIGVFVLRAPTRRSFPGA